jgi:hypothetical protein
MSGWEFVRFSGFMVSGKGDKAYGWLTNAKNICIVLLLFVILAGHTSQLS